MRKLIALLLLFTLVMPCAGALTLPYGEDTVLSVLDLTPAQRALADYLYEPVFNGVERIELPKGTLYDDVSLAMGCLMQDYPELFHLGKNYSVGYYTDEPEYATWVEPTYRMNAREAASLRSQLYAQAYLAADYSPDLDVIFDVLCQAVSYGGDTEMRHTAVGALLQGQATCEGYAQAVTLICRMKGVPCGVIVGDAMDSSGNVDRHSWNIARMNGYTLIDLTWNDQNGLGVNTRWYYGLSARQMGVDHFPDAGQTIPLCGEQDNWHRLRGLVVTTQDQLDAAFRLLTETGSVNVRIPDGALYSRVAHDTHACLDDFNRRNPDSAFYGAYSIITSDAQQCVILQRAE